MYGVPVASCHLSAVWVFLVSSTLFDAFCLNGYGGQCCDPALWRVHLVLSGFEVHYLSDWGRNTWPVQRGFMRAGLGRCSTVNDEERLNQVLKCLLTSPKPPYFSPVHGIYLLSSICDWSGDSHGPQPSPWGLASFLSLWKKEGKCDKAIVLANDPPPSLLPQPTSFVTQKATEKHVRAILKARRGTEKKP